MFSRIFHIEKHLKKKNSAFLFGARGVGKTILSTQFIQKIKNRMEYNLLHNETFSRYLKSPHLFRMEIEEELENKKSLFVFVDEVQKIPALLDEVHDLITKYQQRIQFLLTGSSARKLKKSGANLLAGRLLILKLHPLTHLEYGKHFNQILRIGSLPGILASQDVAEMMLQSYVATYLREEIMQEALVRRVESFARFLEIAGQYHGKQVNATLIAEAAGVSVPTVTEYFQILEDTLLMWRLPGWSQSVKKQLRMSPKIYLFDNGVANALRGELNLKINETSSRFGDLFEAYLIQEVFRMRDYTHSEYKFSYWKTNTDLEVDLIVSRGIQEPIMGIEIKSYSSPQAKDLHGLKSFAKEYPKAKLQCWCRTPKPYQIENIKVMPWQDGIKKLYLLP